MGLSETMVLSRCLSPRASNNNIEDGFTGFMEQKKREADGQRILGPATALDARVLPQNIHTSSDPISPINNGSSENVDAEKAASLEKGTKRPKTVDFKVTFDDNSINRVVKDEEADNQSSFNREYEEARILEQLLGIEEAENQEKELLTQELNAE